MRWEQAQADDDSILQSLEVVVVKASVDDVKEDGRNLRRPRQGVLDRSVFRQQFGGQIVGRDIFVVRGKRVALQAEGADP